MKFPIHKDITEAFTLPASFYANKEVLEALKNQVFSKSWQLVGDTDLVKLENTVYPFVFLDHFLEEPLILTKTENNDIFCLSNVCTHRGNLLVHSPQKCKSIQCAYHGKRFRLDGKFLSMPKCDGMKNFPSEADNLPQVPLKQWKNFLFTSLEPAIDFEELIQPLEERVGFMPFDKLVLDKTRCRDYLVKAHWALYCDNYLEGFHIPFVHPDLNKLLDSSAYETLIFKWCNLQIGISSGGEHVFELPSSSPDYGKTVAAYYFWIFPNLMLNFYPWGISINIVKPIHLQLTKISYLTYVWDSSKQQVGAGGDLDKVEREDEQIVESVQKGIQSRLYKKGRFSPKMEKGVHHFHSLIADFMNS
ncbi:MAG: choline monooxygenase [Bacteroidia bacterium]|nr:MAG: choline monooxygenase [Bacteroidia bacterium]